MPRKHLSPTSIAAFKPATESFLWDDVAPRLAVRARPSGAKTFIFKGTLNYRDIRVTIGSVESCPIAKAREEANRFQRMIDEGLDPRAVLKQEEADRAAELSRREAEAEAKRIESERFAAPAMEAWQAYLVDARRPVESAKSAGPSKTV